MEDKRNIPIIEWEHLDKKKFYVFGLAMTMMIRISVYPFALIRTRLQIQKGKSLYQGTFDAFVKILRTDGVLGLYRGFLVNTLTLVSGQCYVTTYELTRRSFKLMEYGASTEVMWLLYSPTYPTVLYGGPSTTFMQSSSPTSVLRTAPT
uniref:Solute carrier family 25 member 44 n=1 Tax=Vombatus ursinus TaxID=29139 RepID=A0A4X2L327_VOMUR